MKNLNIYIIVIFFALSLRLLPQQGSIKIISPEGSYIKGNTGTLFVIRVDIGTPDTVSGLTGVSFHLNWTSPDLIEAANSQKGSFFGIDQLLICRDFSGRLEAGVSSTTGPYGGSGSVLVCTLKVNQKVSGTVKVLFDLTDISALNAEGKTVQLKAVNNQFAISLCETMPLGLLFPNGGELIKAGTTREITWSSKDVDSIRLDYSLDNGTTWQTITGGMPAAIGKYTWTVPAVSSMDCRIRISSTSDPGLNDISDRLFVIYPERQLFGPYLPDEYTLALLHFDGDLKNGSSFTSTGSSNGSGIGFSADNPLGSGQSVRINNKDYCGSSVSIAQTECLDLQGDWTIEFWMNLQSFGSGCVTWTGLISKPSDNPALAPCYQIGIWDNGLQVFGQYFDGKNAAPRVFSSSGKFSTGMWYHFAFIRDTKNRKVKFLIHDSNRKIIDSREEAYATSDIQPMRSLKDLLIGSPFNGYIDELRISNTVRDFSPASLKFISPKAFDVLYSSKLHKIEWTSQNVNKIKIEFSANNGADWAVIAGSIDAAALYYNWTVPSVISDSCKIRVTDLQDTTVFAQSLLTFSIRKPAIHLSAPVNGEKWYCGSKHDITWSSQGISDVRIMYSADEGLHWTLVANVPALPAVYSWTIPDTPSDKCLLKLLDAMDPGTWDLSSKTFTIENLTSAENTITGIPKEFGLSQNYPNPFNPATAIKFQLPEKAFVEIKIFDQSGRRVATLVNQEKPAGYHIVYWNGRNSNGQMVSSGVYLLKLTAGSYTETLKMNMLK